VTPAAEMGPSILGGWRGFTRSQNVKEEARERKIVSCGDRRLLTEGGRTGGRGGPTRRPHRGRGGGAGTGDSRLGGRLGSVLAAWSKDHVGG
jgi:hypothetical protein